MKTKYNTLGDDGKGTRYSHEIVDDVVRNGRRLRALAVRDAFNKFRDVFTLR